MTSWQYTAVPTSTAAGSGRKRGEMSGASAADVRAALRRIGWQVVEIRPARRTGSAEAGEVGLLEGRWHAHQRRRRQLERSDLCDSLATMLESGVPVLEAVRTLVSADRAGRGGTRTMLIELRDALQGGASFSEAAKQHPGWFDAAQVAMIEAGQQRGEMAEVLRHLAGRSARSEELARRLSAALAYPAVVAMVGLGVVLFLSVKTLPELTGEVFCAVELAPVGEDVEQLVAGLDEGLVGRVGGGDELLEERDELEIGGEFPAFRTIISDDEGLVVSEGMEFEFTGSIGVELALGALDVEVAGGDQFPDVQPVLPEVGGAEFGLGSVAG